MNLRTTNIARPGLANNRELVVIVGETASGKSALALMLAVRYNGEIIAADSRTVYRGMDIGTAKPSSDEQAHVPHHLLNIVKPDEVYNVSVFQEQANEAIKDIHNRGKLPILVGGTGLYTDSVLYGFSFRTPVDSIKRAEIEQLSTESMQSYLLSHDIKMPLNSQNRRHLIRAIETEGQQPLKNELRPQSLVIGLTVPKETLDTRISGRVEAMFTHGLEAEVCKLADKYGWENEAMSAVGYREWKDYFAGIQTLEQTKQLIITHTRQYAKRQRTWFKRSTHINWVSTPAAAQQIVMDFLQQNKEANPL